MSFSIDRKRLPPINLLIAFEAAARLGSFALAGAEVHLTASAISRQVKALEDYLGVSLFDRIRQRIVLTEAGRALAPQVRHILGRLLSVSDHAEQLRHHSRTLTIGVLPAFANFWLIPRLADFMAQNPEIQLNFVSLGVGFDYEGGGIDAAIHTNTKLWIDSRSMKLGEENMIAVASAAWMDRHQPVRPHDLAQHTLIDLGSRPYMWAQWFRHNEVSAAEGGRHVKFGHYSMVYEAAVASLGVALLPKMLCQQAIQSGRLVRTPGLELHTGASYFLVHPVHREEYPPLHQFRQWVSSQLEDQFPETS